MTGRVIAVVGPSGVGKDSVMAGLVEVMLNAQLVRRTITRSEGAGEVFDSVTEARFEQMVAAGAFALHWRSHALRYGVPVGLRDDIRAGNTCLVNLSRTVLEDAARLFPGLLVLNITAAPETLAARLATRGRETEAAIAARLAEGVKPLPSGLDVREVPNDGALADTVAQALAACQTHEGEAVS